MCAQLLPRGPSPLLPLVPLLPVLLLALGLTVVDPVGDRSSRCRSLVEALVEWVEVYFFGRDFLQIGSFCVGSVWSWCRGGWGRGCVEGES